MNRIMNSRICCVTILITLLIHRLVVAVDTPQESVSFSTSICKTVTLNYLLYLPPGYREEPAKEWPLILFLHGSGERGEELERVKNTGLPKVLDGEMSIPFIVVSPQCPRDETWQNGWIKEGLNALLEDVMKQYRVDRRRVYLTGLSMGGYGTWALGAAHPEKFAALAPICGGGDTDWAGQLRRIPIWTFHGAKDDVVPVSAMSEMTNAMHRYHGTVRATVYPEAGHDSWSATYTNSELYAWFLTHELTNPELIKPDVGVLSASSGDPVKVFDGNMGTRWESEWSDPQWLVIDLKKPTPLHSMLIFWEGAFAKAYEVLASDDRATWRVVAEEHLADGDVDRMVFADDFAPRCLKLLFKERGTQWGYSIWEIELE